MCYDEFKAAILEILKDFYENDAEIGVAEVMKNNGFKLEGLWIRDKESDVNMAPLVYLQNVYRKYQGGLPLEDCVGEIIDFANMNAFPNELMNVSAMILNDWEFVKGRVYPFLLATGNNEEMLKDMVSKEFLDMSVAYVIREQVGDGIMCGIKVSCDMLKRYGISLEELHNQAMANLRNDDYVLQDIEAYLREQIQNDRLADAIGLKNEGLMYIFKNQARYYGAAGIISRDILKRLVPDVNQYVLPYSLHELIFIPDNGRFERGLIDGLMNVLAEECVRKEELLNDHCYYYDADTGEIRSLI